MIRLLSSATLIFALAFLGLMPLLADAQCTVNANTPGSSIQQAVNSGCSEIRVSPGTYHENVVIPSGSYQWLRYRLEAGTAQKRRFYTQVTWWFGDFYSGRLDQVLWTGAWNPLPLVTVELSGEHNVGRLPSGRFTQTVVGNRLRLNISPDLSIASYVQYDTDSKSVGTNTRLRWTFLPVADLFVVYNHNIRSLIDRWGLDSNQLLIKLQYAWRM